MRGFSISVWSLLIFGLLFAGCNPTTTSSSSSVPVKKTTIEPSEEDDVEAERAKLSAEDKALVDAQEWCVISSEERLGSMGPPIKLMIQDQPVFICCKGCKKKAEADPEKTLAKLAELKAKKKQTKG